MSGLGIKLEQIIFYIVCFIITMFVLDKFLFKQIVQILNKREAEIEKALAEKDELEDKLSHINREADKIVHDAKENARHILEEARVAVEPEKKRILDAAYQEAEQIILESKHKGEEILQSARLKSQDEAVELLKNMLTKAMSDFQIATAEQQNIIAKIIKTKL